MAVCAVAAVFVVAGCGDDDDGGSNGGSNTSANEDNVKVAADYVGTEPGKADAAATPITIGYANGTGSFASATHLTDITKAAVRFMNEELGGLNGHPIKLEVCANAGSEEQVQACARQLANNDAVSAVLYGELVVGGATFQDVIKKSGKPLFGMSPNGPDDLVAKNAFYTTGGFLTGGSVLTYLKEFVKAKTVSQIWPDSPEVKPFVDATKAQADAAGLDATVALIPANASDVTASLVAANVKDADSITPIVFPPQCIALAKGLTQLGADDIPLVTLPTCADASVSKALGDLPTWSFYQSSLNTTLPDDSGQVASYLYALNKYLGEARAKEVADLSSAPVMFGTTLWMAKMLNQAGPDSLTPENIAAEAGKYEGPLFLGQPDMKFGVKPLTAVGGTSIKVYTYTGNGKYEDSTDGKWVTPTLQDLGLG